MKNRRNGRRKWKDGRMDRREIKGRISKKLKIFKKRAMKRKRTKGSCKDEQKKGKGSR